ncbi:Uncharacterized [Syntrophomonas zehnderi OL-4]|uniref:Uncharacterized n=1 Tax=Syntrophomonas zehnderi OL-4 TaxID=690567 RepID=A0A0E4GBD3_9FIRM|nr:hypothetical protein [Syntrophomonas zehnderi]CFX88865.1 Uncharacterized [Syntrophomonas zehnderi OL-4]
MIASFALSPAAAKRLIARGLINEPIFRHAYTTGKLIISVGTTNSYIAHELGLINASEQRLFAAGVVTKGLPCVAAENRLPHICLEKGQRVEGDWVEFLNGFGRDDVFIKGANAFDANGNAAVLMANPQGGTAGAAWGVLASRGSKVLIPVGHEKMIPSCQAATKVMGIERVDNSLGLRCGLAVLPVGQIYTEINALHALFGVDATIVSAGGVDGSEGSIMVAIEGEQQPVRAALTMARSLLKEKPLSVPKQSCNNCIMDFPCFFKQEE